MPILEAQIETERASRYLRQLCKHADAMSGRGSHTPGMHLHNKAVPGEVEVAAAWSDTDGTLTFTPWGQCTLAADTDTLTLRIAAADEDGLHHMRDVLTRDLERFSSRDPLTVTWRQPTTNEAAGLLGTRGPAVRHRRGHRRTSLSTILLVLVVILLIGLHVGLAGSIGAGSRLTGMVTNVVVGLVVLKIAVLVLVRFRMRRRPNPK